jgi:malate dehydrogenase (oxaloacetate-decarboxylating)
MPQYESLKIVPKIPIENNGILSLVYTPGVGSSSLKIQENPDMLPVLTNTVNSVGVFAFDYESALKRALFLKSTLLIDAYPFCVKEVAKEDLKFVIENICVNFCGIDLSLMSDFAQDIEFNVPIPVLKGAAANLKDFFGTISRNVFKLDISQLKGDTSEKSLQLHELAGGVIETELCEEKRAKPLAVVSDGTSVLGFGNIGSAASIPVLEGKTALYSELAGVDGVILALKSQEPEDIIKTVQILENSFSGIHLEDIAAPQCFYIENTLINTLDIPVFHDDQHGTAIIVLAGLLNALILAGKELSDIKIVISGAGAAGSAIARLLQFAGAKNMYLCDSKGAVYEGRPQNNPNLEDISKFTNLERKKGGLREIIKGADVFIGVSRGNIVDEDMIKSMSQSGKGPVVFALSNPVPEIMPDKAKNAGAFIFATGRSDFANQINNSLVFPGMFRGVLEAGVPEITNEIKLESAIAIASLVDKTELTADKIVPESLNRSVPYFISETIKSKFSHQ